MTVIAWDGQTLEAIEAQLALRAEARRNRDFAGSDRIRDELKAKGVLIEDGKDGQRWRYAGSLSGQNGPRGT